MSIKIQEIEVGQEKIVLVPKKTWKKILEKLEDIDDIRAYDEAMAKDDGYRISHEDLKKELFSKE